MKKRRGELGCDESDEPRTDGKSALDLFRESCEAADADKQREKESTPNTVTKRASSGT